MSFHEGNLVGKGHCNNAWVVFKDYVLVVDANFPSGAREIIPKIKAQTDKTNPVRVRHASPRRSRLRQPNLDRQRRGPGRARERAVGDAEVRDRPVRRSPGRWEGELKQREDLKSTRLTPPSLLYRDLMIFDDGVRRVELRYFGAGHTHGDGFAWLPKERILFTGDAAVNGPFDCMGDGDSAAWIETLGKVQALGAAVVGPGHGPAGDGGVLEAQRQYSWRSGRG